MVITLTSKQGAYLGIIHATEIKNDKFDKTKWLLCENGIFIAIIYGEFNPDRKDVFIFNAE